MIKIWQIAGATALCVASAAQAEEHRVVLTGFSYFPSVIYAQPGDQVVFINESGEEQTVVGKDTGWVVGPLQDQQEGELTVDEETELAFFAAYEDPDAMDCSNGSDGSDGNCGTGNDDPENPNYGTYEGAPIKAEITFSEAPLSSNG